MPQVDVFKNREYLSCGNIFPLEGEEVISSASPEWYGKRILCNKSGGVQIRFFSNAETVRMIYAVKNIKSGSFQHTGITGQIGIAVSYRLLKEQDWHNIELSYPRDDMEQLDLRMNKFRGWSEGYELAIALPAFAYISSFLIETESGSRIRPAVAKQTILLVGGPAAMGSGTSGRHLSISNILFRHTDYVVEENTFFHWKWLEEALYIDFRKYKMVLLEMPVENVSTDYLKRLGKQLIDKVCMQADRKVILWHQLQFEGYDQKDNLAVIKEIARKYGSQIRYEESLYLCSNAQIDKYMIDRNYMGDWGHIYIADMLMKQLEE